MKKLVLGITVLLVIALMIGVGVFKLGLIPVNADVPPSGLEARFIPIAVHASVASHAEEQPNPLAHSDENLIAGGEVYTFARRTQFASVGGRNFIERRSQ